MIKKTLFVIIIFSLVLVGCTNKKQEIEEEKIEEKVVTKKDKDKGFIYYSKVKDIILSNGEKYEISYPIVNFDCKESENVTFELKSIVNKYYRNLDISNGLVKSGHILVYDYYESKNFVSLLQNKKYYLDGNFVSEKTDTYVFDKKTGKVLDNDDLLKYYDYTENKLYEKLERILKSDDVSYTLMIIKESGYQLYVNNKDLVMIYYEIDNDSEIKKEVILR